MKKFVENILTSKILLLLVSIFLILIPFQWFDIGAMDIGGDSSRLYYYDPYNTLLHEAFYNIRPEGMGRAAVQVVILPFTTLVFLIKLLIPSGYFIVSIFNVLKLFGGFIFMYLIVRKIMNQDGSSENFRAQVAAVVSGLLYVVSPVVIGSYDKALLSHDQVFLNPLMFFLILQYVLTKKTFYMFSSLLISFIFAHNFSWVSAPPIISFYPFMTTFIIIYAIFIKKVSVPIRGLLIGLILFSLLHAFHIVPTVILLVDESKNLINSAVFTQDKQQLVNYFYAVLSSASVKNSLIFLVRKDFFTLNSFLITGVVIAALATVSDISKKKIVLLVAFIWAILFYFVTANIGFTGVKIYELLLDLPGFAMFRNFNGQWAYSYSFFYSILLGVSLNIVFSKIKNKTFITLAFLFLILIGLNGYRYFSGEKINKVHPQSNNVKVGTTMGDDYKETLSFVRSLESDGKILTLPFTDYEYQVVHGINNGAYVGPSTLRLTGKKDFSGYSTLVPFSDILYKSVGTRDYPEIKKILKLLNIKYIFHNSDPQVYDATFPGYPYSYTREFFPKTQKEYTTFIQSLGTNLIFSKNHYLVYVLDDLKNQSLIYASRSIVSYDNLSELDNSNGYSNVVFVEKNVCKNDILNLCSIQKDEGPSLSYKKISPTKYSVKISNAHLPYVLVLAESFSNGWKVHLANSGSLSRHRNSLSDYLFEIITTPYQMTSSLLKFNEEIYIDDNRHFLANGYANGWYIFPQDSSNRFEYELIIEYTYQQFGFVALLISATTFFIVLVHAAVSYLKVIKNR